MTFVPIKRRNTAVNRKRVRTLGRRLEYLDERIAEYDLGFMDGDPAWDRAERAALQWALEKAQEWIDADPLFEILWSCERFPEEATLENLIDLLGSRAEYQGEDVEIVGAHFDPRRDGHQVVRLILRPLASDPLRSVSPERLVDIRRAERVQ